jgi:D-alanyl-D-alanine carboxypeptidase
VELFQKKINRFMNKGYSYLEAYRLSSQAVTVPGSSEHEIGLALDIYSPDYKQLNSGFGDTEEGKWLAEHCAEYGFILRYPLGKEEITGIEFEPWHFRYVGKAAAKIITENEITLEEFVLIYDL